MPFLERASLFCPPVCCAPHPSALQRFEEPPVLRRKVFGPDASDPDEGVGEAMPSSSSAAAPTAAAGSPDSAVVPKISPKTWATIDEDPSEPRARARGGGAAVVAVVAVVAAVAAVVAVVAAVAVGTLPALPAPVIQPTAFII